MAFADPLEIGDMIVSVETAIGPSHVNQKEIFILLVCCNTHFRKTII
jgi:hypothetical protein